MNKDQGTLSLVEIKKRIPAFNAMTALLVLQVYGKHNKTAKRLGGHFEDVFANTKRSGKVVDIHSDEEETDDKDHKPEVQMVGE